MATLELVLPAAGGRTPETGLLDAIPAMRTRLAFEVLATHERIQLLLTAPRREQRALRQQLRAHLPQLALRNVEDPVVAAWTAHEEEGSLILEFGLGSEWMRPLWTQGSSPQHLLTSLMATLDDLDPGELALLQVQFQRCRSAWAHAASQALVTPAGSPFLVDAPEMMGLAKRKLASPLLAVGVRLGCCAASPERAWQIAQGVAQALGVFTADASNQLIPLDPGEAPPEDLRADLLLRTNHRVGMLLNQQELGYLVQLPGPDVQSEKLARSAGSTRPAPALVQGTGLLLGTNEHAGESVEVRLPQKLRSRHLHVLGASGTGKSTLLLQMALQDLSEGRGLALIDPHGDLVDDLLARMPESRHDDLVLVDPSDPDHTVGFNVLSAQTDLERQLLSSDMVAMFRRLSTSWGDQMTSVLGNAILAFLESESGGTLADLRRFLVEKEFRAHFLQGVRDEEVRYFWAKEFPLLSGRPQAPLLTRLDTFLRPRLIRQMVAQRQSSFDLRSLMDNRGVLLVRLSQGAIGEENAALLGSLFVSRIQQAAQSRQELEESDRIDFTLYLDEFHNYLTPSMAGILSGGRKYHLGLVLAHQDLGQLGRRDGGVVSAAITNPATRICFRLGDADARALEGGFEHFTQADLQGLAVGQAICRVEQAGCDFNLNTTALEDIRPEEARDARERATSASRRRYARARTDVDQELAASRAWLLVDSRPSPQPSIAPREDVAAQQVDPRPAKPAPPPEDNKTPQEETAEEGVVAAGPRLAEGEIRTNGGPGRGGEGHRLWQRRFKQLAQAAGWRARIEARLDHGPGFVDVLVERGDVRIGVEIGITTDAEHEFANLQKCARDGLTIVVCAHAEEAVRAALVRLVAEAGALGCECHVGSPEDTLLWFEERLQERPTPGPSVIRGYRVREEGAPGASEEMRKRLADLARRLWREPGR